MKHSLLSLALAGASFCAFPVMADEVSGAELLTTISGRSYDCVQGEIPLEWHVSEISPDATTVGYTAVVRGKTVAAEYEITSNGRLSSDGYGAERIVEQNPDGSLTVTRADGKAMICIAR